jgi:hypothetical protein
MRTEATTRRAALGALAAVPALALPTVAAAATVTSDPVPLPAEIEGPEFTNLLHRFRTLFEETMDAQREERTTQERFAAEAPLRPAKPPGKYPFVSYDIVRKRPTFENHLKSLKAAAAKAKKAANSEKPSLRLKRSVLDAYHDRADNPIWTKEGEIQRKMLGASSRWETALVESAEATGYAGARRRRRTLEIELRDVIGAILKHKPKTLSAIKVQAVACTCSPRAQWVKDPQAAAFLKSIADFNEEQLSAPAVVAA